MHSFVDVQNLYERIIFEHLDTLQEVRKIFQEKGHMNPFKALLEICHLKKPKNIYLFLAPFVNGSILFCKC